MGLLDGLKIKVEKGEENDEEIQEEIAQDPEPDERPAATKRRISTRAAAPARKQSSARLAKQVANDLAGLLEGGAVLWGLTDQCCAPVLEEQAQAIANALVPVLARHPRLLAAFADSDIAAYALSSVAIGRAVQPVAKAVWHNHISKAHKGDAEHVPGGVNLDAFPAFKPAA
jgi:hypothetical protein